jgi:hypothetical protein
MRNLIRQPAPRKASRRPDAPGPSEQLRGLARELAQLNVSGRLDPEAIVGAKHSIVRGLHRIAAELER